MILKIQLYPTVIIDINKKVSEGSRDTEDWSNDAENSALHHRICYFFIIILNSYF